MRYFHQENEGLWLFCAWRILRLSSLTDQIFIKAQRIRSIELNDGHQKVG